MASRFKLDENMPRDAVTLLRNLGHDVHTVVDEQLGGNADPRVFDACQAEGRVLVTFDLDFSDIRAYPPSNHTGIWILRPRTQSIQNTLGLLKSAARMLDAEPTSGRLWIIEPERIRIRE